MRGRNAVDPELARVVEQRLERLLAERGPRRAATGSVGAGPDPDEVDSENDSENDSEDEREGVRVESEAAGSASSPRQSRREARLGWSARGIGVVDGERTGADGRGGFGRAHLTVIGALVLIGILLGGWAVLRARPVALPAAAVTVPRASPTGSTAEPGTSTSPAPSAPPPAARSASGTPSPRASPTAVVVHVLGAVRSPGLVELAAGARVQDAIEAAGGLRSGARLGELNLAQPLADGDQLVVGQGGRRSEVRGSGVTSSSGSTGSTGSDGSDGSAGSAGNSTTSGPLDLNSASAADLETLPGVGPVTAAKILAWRQEHGRFSRVEELQEVSGIGPKTYAELAPRVRV